MLLDFKGMGFRTVEVDKEGDLIVVVTERQRKETFFLLSWDAVRLASPVITALLDTGKAHPVEYTILGQKQVKRLVHKMVLTDVDESAFELFALIVHHKAPSSTLMQIQDTITLAILTQELRC